MKRLLFLLLLIPGLVFAMKPKEVTKIYQQMISDWNQCNDLVNQLQQLDTGTDLYLQIIDYSVSYCQSALKRCNQILDGISGKAKKRKDEDSRRETRRSCFEHQQIFERRMSELMQLRSEIRFQRAVSLYEKSQEVAESAAALAQCRRTPDNVNDVVAALEQASALYNEAADLAEQALQWIDDCSKEADRNVLLTTIISNREAAERVIEDAISWPERVLLEIVFEELSEDY